MADAPPAALAWGLLTASAVCDAVGLVLVGGGLGPDGPAWSARLAAALGSIRGLVGLGLFLVAPVLFAGAVSRLPMTVAWPAQVGLNLLVVTAAAVGVMGEGLTPARGVGLLCLGAGVWLLPAGRR